MNLQLMHSRTENIRQVGVAAWRKTAVGDLVPGWRCAGDLLAVRMSRRYRAAPERVFAAWVRPALARRWFFATASQPLTEFAADPRVGGYFRGLGGAGEDPTCAGHYAEIAAPERLVFNLDPRHHRGRTTRVTVEIGSRDEGCRLTLTHEGVTAPDVPGTRARWLGMLYGLNELLDSTDD